MDEEVVRWSKDMCTVFYHFLDPMWTDGHNKYRMKNDMAQCKLVMIPVGGFKT